MSAVENSGAMWAGLGVGRVQVLGPAQCLCHLVSGVQAHLHHLTHLLPALHGPVSSPSWLSPLTVHSALWGQGSGECTVRGQRQCVWGSDSQVCGSWVPVEMCVRVFRMFVGTSVE